MPNKLTSKQPEVLSHEACDAFQEFQRYLKVWKMDEQWIACDLPQVAYGDSRQAAITAYWQKYHKGWTPPIIHDVKDADEGSADWAWRYLLKMRLNIVRRPGHGDLYCILDATSGNRIPDSGWYTILNIDSLIRLLVDYKAKYDPDKPTREEAVDAELRSAVELLRRARNAMFDASHPLRREIDTFLKAKSTAESPDLGGDEESEADHVD